MYRVGSYLCTSHLLEAKRKCYVAHAQLDCSSTHHARLYFRPTEAGGVTLSNQLLIESG